jgi:hypothetical protein
MIKAITDKEPITAKTSNFLTPVSKSAAMRSARRVHL